MTSGPGIRAVVSAVLSAFLAVTALASCTSNGSKHVSGPRITWQSCGRGFLCAREPVPVNASHPTAGTVSLRLIRHPATDHRAGTLVVDPGGVGGAGTDWLRHNLRTLGSLTQRFDVVVVESRESHVACPAHATKVFLATDPVPGSTSEKRSLITKGKSFLDSCRHDTGSLFDHLGPIAAASDIQTIRSGLGEKELTFLGLSSGANTGIALLDHQRAVRAAVLDGPEPTVGSAGAFVTDRALGLEDTMDRFLGTCNNDCPLAGGEDNPAAIAKLLRGLGRHPLEVGGEALTSAKAYLSIEEYLDDPRGWPLLDDALHQAIDGDGAALLKGFHAYAGDVSPGPAVASRLESACESHAWPSSLSFFTKLAGRLAGEAPVFGAETVWRYAGCRGRGRAPRPPDPSASNRVLMIAATHDLSVSYRRTQRYAGRLGWPLLSRLGVGHTSYLQSACVRDESAAFLANLDEPKPHTRCPSDFGPGSTG